MANGNDFGLNAFTIDLNKIPTTREQREEILRESNAIAEQISPPGSFPQLTPLLDQRRSEYGIIDAYFESQPLFDCVWIFQLEMNRGDNFIPDGRIIKSDQSRAREKETAPRGILVGAGLMALDSLKSHGVELGHIVRFIKLAPYRIQVGFAGTYQYVLQMRVGDILASEDLAAKLKSGKLQMQDISVVGEQPDHRYVSGEDEFTPPKRMPFVPEDS